MFKFNAQHLSFRQMYDNGVNGFARARTRAPHLHFATVRDRSSHDSRAERHLDVRSDLIASDTVESVRFAHRAFGGTERRDDETPPRGLTLEGINLSQNQDIP